MSTRPSLFQAGATQGATGARGHEGRAVDIRTGEFIAAFEHGYVCLCPQQPTCGEPAKKVVGVQLYRAQSQEDDVAKGQKRSNREKKKAKQVKKKLAPAPSSLSFDRQAKPGRSGAPKKS